MPALMDNDTAFLSLGRYRNLHYLLFLRKEPDDAELFSLFSRII